MDAIKMYRQRSHTTQPSLLPLSPHPHPVFLFCEKQDPDENQSRPASQSPQRRVGAQSTTAQHNDADVLKQLPTQIKAKPRTLGTALIMPRRSIQARAQESAKIATTATGAIPQKRSLSLHSRRKPNSARSGQDAPHSGKPQSRVTQHLTGLTQKHEQAYPGD